MTSGQRLASSEVVRRRFVLEQSAHNTRLRMKILPLTLVAALIAVPEVSTAASLWVDSSSIGSIKIGMPLSKIPVRLEEPIQRTAFNQSGRCFYVNPRNGQSFNMMIEDDVLTRFDIVEPGIKTKEGVAVGDPIKKVRETYGAAAIETPNFYDDAQPEFTINSKDGRYSLRFSTTDGKVTAIIAGRAKSVRYVEGCL
jgi:hypothetical protein